MVQRPVPPLNSLPARIAGNLAAAGTTLLLFAAILVVNLLQMASLLVLPFSRRLFRGINTGLAGFWWGLANFWTEKLYGVRAVISGDDVPSRENAIVVANHQTMPDVIALWSLAVRKGRLGDMKWAVKDVLKWLPGVGWGMLFIDCLFLKRHWERDQRMIHDAFSKFSRDQIPIWLVSFSEGTRITAAKLERSRRFAKESGMPLPSNVLFPRTKGFVASVKGLRDHITAVYDVTIAYPGGVPTLWQMVQGRVKEYHLHVKRFALKDLPLDDEELARWLVERFYEKDAYLGRLLGTPAPTPA